MALRGGSGPTAQSWRREAVGVTIAAWGGGIVVPTPVTAAAPVEPRAALCVGTAIATHWNLPPPARRTVGVMQRKASSMAATMWLRAGATAMTNVCREATAAPMPAASAALVRPVAMDCATRRSQTRPAQRTVAVWPWRISGEAATHAPTEDVSAMVTVSRWATAARTPVTSAASVSMIAAMVTVTRRRVRPHARRTVAAMQRKDSSTAATMKPPTAVTATRCVRLVGTAARMHAPSAVLASSGENDHAKVQYGAP